MSFRVDRTNWPGMRPPVMLALVLGLACGPGDPADRSADATVAGFDDGPADMDRPFLANLESLGCEVVEHPVRDAPGWWSWNLRALRAAAHALGDPGGIVDGTVR